MSYRTRCKRGAAPYWRGVAGPRRVWPAASRTDRETWCRGPALVLTDARRFCAWNAMNYSERELAEREWEDYFPERFHSGGP